MRYVRGFGRVSAEEHQEAEDFFDALTSRSQSPRGPSAQAEAAPFDLGETLRDPYEQAPAPLTFDDFSPAAAESDRFAESAIAEEGCGCSSTTAPAAESLCESCTEQAERLAELAITIGPEYCATCQELAEHSSNGESLGAERCAPCQRRQGELAALQRGLGPDSCAECRQRALDGETEPYEPPEHVPDEDFEQDGPANTTTPTTPSPYLPTGGRNFVPAAGTFNCGPTDFTVKPASFLPQPTTDTATAITTALTAAGLSARQRRRINTSGLVPIAAEFGGAALSELFQRLRWSPAKIVSWGNRADKMLVQRLLIHVPGHFRELARRAPGPAEAYVLECLGWLLMRSLRDDVAAATRTSWWIPPAPPFVSAVPNPIPSVSTEVRNLLTRRGYINTTMTPGRWNARYRGWHTSLPGLLWNAEVNGPTPGLPFYASLVTVPTHVDTSATRTSISSAWTQRVTDTDRSHTPHAAGATTVTLSGLQNAVALRRCDNSNANLPSGAISPLSLQGLELAYNFPMNTSRTKITRLSLMSTLHPIYTAVFSALHTLGWNDLVYQTSGAGCFRGIKHSAHARVQINGSGVLVNPFDRPNATTVTNINTHFTQAQRNTVVAATRTARRMSEHGIGAAVDLNVPENGQRVAGRQYGSMDPRVVALFEAFNFRWGACFTPTDPHHFEYCTSACAPTPVSAGPAPTSTPGMMPSGSGPVIA